MNKFSVLENIKSGLGALVLSGLILFGLASCSKSDEPKDNGRFDVSLEIPASIDVSFGEKYTFKAKEGRAPRKSDELLFEQTASSALVIKFDAVTSNTATITVPESLISGPYKISVRRDKIKRLQGETNVNIVLSNNGMEPDANATVWGIVACDGKGVKDVVVSDGIEVVTTDENGMYQMRSNKKWGYVFVSVPGGYEVPSNGVLPKFHGCLTKNATTRERVDFPLVKADQNKYNLLVFGDIHLANRTSDRAQFSAFTSDVTDYMAAHPGEKFYALTLGDMTWDLYWYDNNYEFVNYLKDINAGIKNLQVFHTMGNHDNDMLTKDNFTSKFKYVRDIAPTYYSFNLGNIHYVVVDDINCSKYDGTSSRKYYCDIPQEQLDWLQKDLQHVDKSVPIVLTSHATFFSPATTTNFYYHDAANQSPSTIKLQALLKGRKVQFITGHSHTLHNVRPQDMPGANGENFSEHNGGAVCASWWWSGHLTKGAHVGTDGAPGGYGIWSINGKNYSFIYKGTGKSEKYQFRTYDLNNVGFGSESVPKMNPNAPADVLKAWQEYEKAYPASLSDANKNTVLINLWNYSPDWKLAVKDEKGNALTVEEVSAYDPYHIQAMSVPRFNNSGLTSVPSFITDKSHHFFKVKCADADVDLTITATDPYGHTYTEKMVRPKTFSTSVYNNEN